jgi:zinc transport system substrate-binding protein
MGQRVNLSVGRVTLIGTAIGLLLAACSGSTTTTPSTATAVVGGATSEGISPQPIGVVAAFAPLAELANRIGGDRVTVTNLTPAGSKSHNVELTPKATEALSNAELVLYLGRGFQPAVQDGIEQLGAAVTRLDLLASLELIAFDDTAGGSVGDELDGGFDPHVWVDPANMAIMAEAVAASLSAVRPQSASVFDANAKKYIAELDALTTDMKAGLANCQSRTMVTGHRAFAYLAQRLDLTQIAIAGISPEIEPNPKDLEAIAKEAKRAGVKTVFFEEALPKDLAETVANEIGADTGSLNPVETISQEQLDAGEGYIDIQRVNLTALQQGLGCS